ncbi:hypothetical protein [Actinomadura sp. 21ATH]|uniref:hypothetical protein n=1 Tax=Actinomadura sp. 21ATH TaxID=1735444 RepID=UPI0035BF4A95
MRSWTGDRYLLCSEDLWRGLDDEEVRDLLRRSRDADHAARSIARLARANGAAGILGCVVGEVRERWDATLRRTELVLVTAAGAPAPARSTTPANVRSRPLAAETCTHRDAPPGAAIALWRIVDLASG